MRGIEVSGVEVKLSMYADDLTAFLHDRESAEFLQVLNEFRLASGLALNVNKSNIMWIGSSKDTESLSEELLPPKA